MYRMATLQSVATGRIEEYCMNTGLLFYEPDMAALALRVLKSASPLQNWTPSNRYTPDPLSCLRYVP